MRSSWSRFVVAAAFCLLAACAGADAAAQVSGTTIADEEVASAADVFTSVASLSSAPCGTPEGEGDSAEAACNRYSLGALIAFAAAGDYAAANGITVDQAELTEAADRFAGGFGEGVLQDSLDEHGSSYDAFVGILRASMLQQAVGEDLVEGSVSDDELRAEYEADLEHHVIAQIDHILLRSKAEAREVYEQVTAPGATRQDFLDLAAEVSADPNAAENRGSLASTPVSQFTEGFAEVLLAMEDGEISEPVQTEFGWHVIHMVDKEVTPFEDVRPDLITTRVGPAFAELVRGLIEDGSIEVNPRFGRLDPETLQVVRITSTDPSASVTPSGPVNAPPDEG